MKRREFIRQTTAAMSTTAISAKRVVGANDRVVLGLIGCGGRGLDVAQLMRKVSGVEYGAVCDVYAPNAERAKQQLNSAARLFGDFRRLLELKEIDAVHIATPDQWHAITTVIASQAGKDVWLAKPRAPNGQVGRAMFAAARKSNRCVPAGTQHRSAPHYREVERIIKSGELGEVRFVRVWNYSNLTPDGVGREPDGAPP